MNNLLNRTNANSTMLIMNSGGSGDLDFDGYDTSKASVSKQLEYLGSYISADLKQPRLKGSLSMSKQSTRKDFY